MTTAELLNELSRRGIELRTEGDQLRYRAPKGALTSDLRSRIDAHRSELLAALRTSREPAVPHLPRVLPAPEERHQPFPLTDLQQAYWLGYSSLFDLGNVAPHAYTEYDLRDVDFPRLDRAWSRLIERHEMLRAIVQPDGRQRILERPPAYRIPIVDLEDESPERRDEHLLKAREEMCHQGPRPDEWPLFEMRAFRLGERHYRLHWSLSLMICDDWSFHVLSEEWLRLYEDPEAALPDLELSFRDYVLGLERFEATEAFRRSLDYWRSRLETLPQPPELPVAVDPRTVDSPRFTRQSRQVKREVWDRVKSRALAIGVTPSAVLCTLYAEVIAHWSRKKRLTLNLLFFNRLPVHPQIDKLVGNFSSTLLLEVDCETPGSFEERAVRLQRQLWRDLEHSRVSGVRVLREIGQRRGGTGRTSAPVVFASNLNTGFDEQETSERAMGAVYNHLQTAHVWLDHQVFELQGGLMLNWDAVEGLFPEGVAEQAFAAYCHLFERLAQSDAAWREPPRGLTPAEHLELRAAVNDTAAPTPRRTLHELFLESRARHPARPAAHGPTGALDYEELGERAAWIGARLRRLGAEPGTLVAVSMDKGWEQVAAVLGVLSSGAAYLPVDPALPPERFRYLLEHGDVRTALTQPWLQEHLPWPDGVQVVVVDGAESAPLDEAAWSGAQAPEDLAYVIFTSGSTGLPKGVMIEHCGAVNTVVDVNQRFSVGPEDRVFALSSLSFDLSVYDVFGTLASGGTVVFPDPEDLRDPARWLEVMEEAGVTVWNSVPALMQMLVDHLEGTGGRLPVSLRLVLLSGDWIPLSLPGRIRSLGDEVQVISLGGATEASIWSILHPVEEVDPAWSSVPYGRPMVNQTFQVLDEELEPRPEWVPGDLYIGGIGLARGYWKDERKTRASFVVHPRTGERLYRTGDLGRHLPSGDIEFLGREDFQVKVQGYRIELGEIEATLARHPDVRQAVVSALGEERGSKRLVGYVVADDEVDAGDLRQFLLERLPDYMVPVTFVSLSALPLTANGKVDRGALPDPGSGSVQGEGGFVAPRDALELQLARLFEDLLDTRPVGITNGFFDLGGDSLLVVRLVDCVRRDLGAELSLATLIEAPTVELLAEVVRNRAEGNASALVALRTAGERPPFFCVHPSGGGVLCYQDLARSLDGDQPFFGLQSPELDDDEPIPPSVEEIAERYLDETAPVQPAAPYRLGGWSMGGVVAYEMAQQLERQGTPVEVVVLIDTEAPGQQERSLDDAALTAWFTRDLGALAGRTDGLAPEELRPLGEEAQMERVFEWARSAGLLLDGGEREEPAGSSAPTTEVTPEELRRFLEGRLGPGRKLRADFIPLADLPRTAAGEIDREELARWASSDGPAPPNPGPGKEPDGGLSPQRIRRLLEVFRSNFRAMLDYAPQPYPGRVVLLKASETVGENPDDASLGWNRLVPDLEVHELAGDHYSLLRPPGVEDLAQQLHASLDPSATTDPRQGKLS